MNENEAMHTKIILDNQLFIIKHDQQFDNHAYMAYVNNLHLYN